MLITQIGMVSFTYMSDDKETCEMLKDLSEEEEEDGEETKDFDESELLKECFANSELLYVSKEISRLNYAENHPQIHRLTLEVQTPPPENTMC